MRKSKNGSPVPFASTTQNHFCVVFFHGSGVTKGCRADEGIRPYE